MKRLEKHIDVIVLAIASFLTHFIFFGYPRETVFDEVHFGKFISGYFNGEYFFDIHPPLAKLLITAFGVFWGYRPEMNFNVIGEHFTDTNFIWLRLLPTLSGALLPIVIYYLCRSLNISKLSAFLAGMLVVFENSLLVQSRFILLDSLLLLFGFSGLLFYLLYKEKDDAKTAWGLLLVSLVLVSFASSIKWTGISFLALMSILECIRLWKTHAVLREWILKTCLFLVIPVLIYFSTFAIHFALLYKTGPGKNFMTPSFQKTLQGNDYEHEEVIPRLGLFDKFTELNYEMLRSNQRLDATHPYSSKWYTWVAMARPIYYWVETGAKNTEVKTDTSKETIAKIYLLGNPFIYWLGAGSIILFIFHILSQVIGRKENWTKKRSTFFLLLVGYFLNLLPFIFIGRVMFLYHYFPSLIFSIVILSYFIDEIKSKRVKKTVAVAMVLISAVTFIYFAPLSYGLPLTREAEEARFWFRSWE